MSIDPVYLDQLEDLRVIQSYQVDTDNSGDHDAVIAIRSEAGATRLVASEYRSHLTHEITDHLIAKTDSGDALLILAPHIGKQLAAKLEHAGINYLDRNGNCHFELGSLYLHIEGRSARPVTRASKGLRSAGYQVLFTYLAEPALINATIRSVAKMAGVSTQPVHDMKRRLLDEEYVVHTKSSIKWLPRRRQDALNLWLHGYATTVRPSLVWATYRVRDNPDELEARLATLLETLDVPEYRWGGASAGYRLTGHYRGSQTTVHVHSLPGDFRKRAKAVADPNGNLVLMNALGDINWQPKHNMVHPLLVYSEMLNERSDRAREAAHELFERFVEPGWSEDR